MFGRIGLPELIVIFMILLLVVGPSKLPKVAQSIGEAVSEFKKGTKKMEKEINEIATDDKTKVEKGSDA